MEVTIDGKKIVLDGPVTALEAARSAGIDIPTLCWHPRVSVLGACRLCMIEVEGINRLLAACTTQVSDGMTILTDTPQLQKVRQTMLELLLCRHPLDSPTCVKGGSASCRNSPTATRRRRTSSRKTRRPTPSPTRVPSWRETRRNAFSAAAVSVSAARSGASPSWPPWRGATTSGWAPTSRSP